MGLLKLRNILNGDNFNADCLNVGYFEGVPLKMYVPKINNIEILLKVKLYQFFINIFFIIVIYR